MVQVYKEITDTVLYRQVKMSVVCTVLVSLFV